MNNHGNVIKTKGAQAPFVFLEEELVQWVRLGLNAQDEWIEEQNGIRRVSTLEGFVVETVPNVRFGRILSQEDATSLCRLLSYAHAFKSYGSLIKAFSVWTTPFQKPFILKDVNDPRFINFKKQVEHSLAERVFQAYVHNRWHKDLPNWSLALLRHGLNNYPLGIDIGVFKTYNPQTKNLEELSIWMKKKNISVVFSSPSTWKVIQNGNVLQVLSNQSDIFQFATSQPLPVENDCWSEEYTPFCLPEDKKVVTGFIPPLLHQALHTYMQDITPQQIEHDVATSLFPQGEKDIFEALSSDQIDAVWMALQQLQKGQSFLLADETGYGKGRVLAALCSIALQQDIQVLFMTEKKGLFSDFYRDCLSVFSSVPDFSLLQSQTKLFTPDGLTLAPPLIKKVHQEKWVWTTYSQFNNNNKERIESILSWMKKPTWVILDEAQNAAGQSNTFAVIEKFTQKAKAVMFSSATFAKNETQLTAYRKVGNYSNDQWKRLQAAFGESNNVRTALSIDWAKRGHFLRRQHPPQALPDEKWVRVSSAEQEQELFSLWWQKMYLLAQQWSKSDKQSAWSKIGGAMARALREFSLLQKTPFLLEEIKKDIAEQRKTVVVSDWTLSSHVARLAKSSQLDDEGEEKEIIIKKEIIFSDKPTWKKSWEDTINDMFDVSLLEYTPHTQRQKISDLKELALQELRKMPDWSISPFDDLLLLLEKENIRSSEISGRSWKLVPPSMPQEGWKIVPLKPKPRPEIIFDFNEGALDCVLLTRAGNSGVSLHSSKTFKDQKQRHLIEWDVAPDPSVRLQFWGRVRRKDQVNEPLRSTLLVDTAFERRNQARNAQKQQKILSHTGEQTLPQVQLYGNLICAQWEVENPSCAKIVDPTFQSQLSQVLLRSVILKNKDQDLLMQATLQGMALFDDIIVRHPVWNYPSRLGRSLWFWGKDDQKLIWQERMWPLQASPNKEDVLNALKQPSLLSWKEAFPSSLSLIHSIFQNSQSFEKGKAVLVVDPQTGQRVRAVILGYEKAHQDSLITSTVHLFLTSHHKPIKTSLLAFISKEVLSASPLNKSPHPSWFGNSSHPVRCMVLTGPAWSVAAWGERNAPKGELIHLVNEDGSSEWGWRMPQQFTYDDILVLPKELASVKHAQKFLIYHPNATLSWVFSPNDVLTVHPQADGVRVVGSVESFNEHIPFPLMRKMRPLRSDQANTKVALLSYTDLMRAFSSWFSQGGSPNIDASFAQWHKSTWAQYAPK